MREEKQGQKGQKEKTQNHKQRKRTWQWQAKGRQGNTEDKNVEKEYEDQQVGGLS